MTTSHSCLCIFFLYNYLGLRLFPSPPRRETSKPSTLKREMEDSWTCGKVRPRSNTVHFSQGLWSRSCLFFYLSFVSLMAPAGGRFCFFINTMDDLKHSKAIYTAEWILCKLTVQTIKYSFAVFVVI